MTQYDQSFKNVEVVFENDDLKNTLGEILEQAWVKTDSHSRNGKISARFLFSSAVAGKFRLTEKKEL